MNKRFGLSERSIRTYLDISGLSGSIKKMDIVRQGAVDTHVLADVSTEDNWTDKDKKEAIKDYREDLTASP